MTAGHRGDTTFRALVSPNCTCMQVPAATTRIHGITTEMVHAPDLPTMRYAQAAPPRLATYFPVIHQAQQALQDTNSTDHPTPRRCCLRLSSQPRHRLLHAVPGEHIARAVVPLKIPKP